MTDLPWVHIKGHLQSLGSRSRNGNLHVVNRGSGRESGPEVFPLPVPATLAIGQLVRNQADSQGAEGQAGPLPRPAISSGPATPTAVPASSLIVGDLVFREDSNGSPAPHCVPPRRAGWSASAGKPAIDPPGLVTPRTEATVGARTIHLVGRTRTHQDHMTPVGSDHDRMRVQDHPPEFRPHPGHHHTIWGMILVVDETERVFGDQSVGPMVRSCAVAPTAASISLSRCRIRSRTRLPARTTSVGIEVIHQTCTESQPG